VALASLKKAAFVMDATIFGQSIHLLMKEEEPLDLIARTLASIGTSDAEVTLARPSLEDVFVSLTKRYSKADSQTQRQAPASS
jgi:hypothetical protein